MSPRESPAEELLRLSAEVARLRADLASARARLDAASDELLRLRVANRDLADALHGTEAA